jgi:hypothetical protein
MILNLVIHQIKHKQSVLGQHSDVITHNNQSVEHIIINTVHNCMRGILMLLYTLHEKTYKREVNVTVRATKVN